MQLVRGCSTTVVSARLARGIPFFAGSHTRKYEGKGFRKEATLLSDAVFVPSGAGGSPQSIPQDDGDAMASHSNNGSTRGNYE